jgi:hypothetical protein
MIFALKISYGSWQLWLELENEAKAIKRGDGHIPGEQ